jgi:tRNA pseudouridine32 synthase/23S rRNA pseudouridine746 synthase
LILDGIALVHIDDDLVVVDKPSGLLAVPGRGPDKADSVLQRLQRRLGPLGVVHRLDMDTSGLMVLARTAAAQRTLSMTFAARRVHKRYVAIVAGIPLPPTAPGGWGDIRLPLIVDWPRRPRSKVCFLTGKPSHTRWRLIGTERHGFAWATRVALEPITGRSHQLRLHLAALGHPILGDPLYAPPTLARATPRLLLHASELALPHPAHGQWVAWNSACPF